MQKLLITGATGFIGRRLVAPAMEQGFDVTALVRRGSRGGGTLSPGITQREGDFERPESLHGVCEGIDAVLHAAGYAHAVDNAEAWRHDTVTRQGTARLVDEAVRAKVARFVFISTVKVFGEDTAGCLDEDAPARPASAYARSKLDAERYLFDAAQKHGMHATVLRLPLTYGPGCKGNLPTMMRAVARGLWRLPPIENKRSMVHVDDVAQAALIAAREARGARAYIVTDGEVYSTARIVDALRRAYRTPAPRLTVPLSWLKAAALIGDAVGRLRKMPFDSATLHKLTADACYVNERIRRDLGFRPRHTFERALPSMLATHHTDSE